ncbi:hypothetical protein B0T21DRAFT_350121 [Apiosordaria backusii]|uniref:Uncharacterized protein n=1 Tax=Apiosordaria backusii TaxID=314023 RepID=A0AA40E5Q0_9PEZI|nr:hypothetical protein B0T21DRAFT_350121 [Apiosordaria backusii]
MNSRSGPSGARRRVKEWSKSFLMLSLEGVLALVNQGMIVWLAAVAGLQDKHHQWSYLGHSAGRSQPLKTQAIGRYEGGEGRVLVSDAGSGWQPRDGTGEASVEKVSKVVGTVAESWTPGRG